MMEDGNYRDAIKLVIQIKESGLKPEVYSYLIAMTAVVEELNEFGKALSKLNGFTKTGLTSDLDEEDTQLIQNYQSGLLEDGVRLCNWVTEEGGPPFHGVVYERLLAMYICAGRGPEAESQLWKMKLVGKEPDTNLYVGDMRFPEGSKCNISTPHKDGDDKFIKQEENVDMVIKGLHQRVSL